MRSVRHRVVSDDAADTVPAYSRLIGPLPPRVLRDGVADDAVRGRLQGRRVTAADAEGATASVLDGAAAELVLAAIDSHRVPTDLHTARTRL